MLQDKGTVHFSLSGEKYQHISSEFKKLLSRVYSKVQREAHSDRPNNISPYQQCCSFLKRPKLPGTYSSFKRRTARQTDKIHSRISLTEVPEETAKTEAQQRRSHIRSTTVAPQTAEEERKILTNKITDYKQLLIAKKLLFEELPKKRKSNSLSRQIGRIHTQGAELPLQRQSLYQFTNSRPAIEYRPHRFHRKGPTFIRTHCRFRTQNLPPAEEPSYDFTPWQTEPLEGAPTLFQKKAP